MAGQYFILIIYMQLLGYCIFMQLMLGDIHMEPKKHGSLEKQKS